MFNEIIQCSMKQNLIFKRHKKYSTANSTAQKNIQRQIQRHVIKIVTGVKN